MVAPLSGFAVTAAMGITNAAADAVISRASAAKGEAGKNEPGKNEARLRETANAFETMFLEQMLNRVFEAGGDEGMFAEAGPGADVYRSMLVKEYAGLVAKSGGVGISNQIYTELLRMQEG